MPKAKLMFARGTRHGFSRANMSAFDDLNPNAVVRELIQNSLDAAKQAKEKKAIVRFQLNRENVADIPEIKEYRKSFDKACGNQDLTDNARVIISRMKDALNRKEHDVLSVLDNGIGLDEKSLSALLGDGVSEKASEGAAGSYGNGHMVSIPTSNLRYVFYAGIQAKGKKISSSHAVLASFPLDRKSSSSGDGYFVRDFKNGKGGHYFDFAKDKELPPFLHHHLDAIQEEWGHGTVVSIPCFNHFGESDSLLWYTVSRVAACNFFVAIERGELEVQVEDLRRNIGLQTLSADTLAEVLEMHQDQERRTGGTFIAGKRAYQAWQAVNGSNRHKLDISLGQKSFGTVEICISTEINDGLSRIDICRNGMWVADGNGVSTLSRYQFTGREPFQAVLLFDDNGSSLHRAVRAAEGPLHNGLDIKRLSDDKKKNLKEAFEKIRDWIKERIPEVSSEAYSTDDLTIESDGEFGEAGKRSQLSFAGSPQRVDHPHFTDPRPVGTGESGGTGSEGGDNTGGGNRGGTGDSRRSKKPLPFRAVMSPSEAKDSTTWFCHIHLECDEDCANAKLSLKIDENTDATCDNVWKSDALTMKSVKVNGVSVKPESDDVAPLGTLAKGEKYKVEVDYTAPDNFPASIGRDLVIQAVFFEPREQENQTSTGK